MTVAAVIKTSLRMHASVQHVNQRSRMYTKRSAYVFPPRRLKGGLFNQDLRVRYRIPSVILPLFSRQFMGPHSAPSSETTWLGRYTASTPGCVPGPDRPRFG